MANQKVINDRGFGYPVMPFHFTDIPDARNAHFLSFFRDKDKMPEWKKGMEVLEETAKKYDKILLTEREYL